MQNIVIKEEEMEQSESKQSERRAKEGEEEDFDAMMEGLEQ
jgi:hypothetical protein